jgi:transcriptional regulator with XRE-family HTH domain
LKKVCEKLRALRKKHQYSQEDVAQVLGISQNAYSLIESGRSKIYLDRLIKISALYKVSIHFFLEEVNEVR